MGYEGCGWGGSSRLPHARLLLLLRGLLFVRAAAAPPPPADGRGRADPAEIRRRRVSSIRLPVTNHVTRTIHAPFAFEYERTGPRSGARRLGSSWRLVTIRTAFAFEHELADAGTGAESAAIQVPKAQRFIQRRRFASRGRVMRRLPLNARLRTWARAPKAHGGREAACCDRVSPFSFRLLPVPASVRGMVQNMLKILRGVRSLRICACAYLSVCVCVCACGGGGGG